MSASGYRIVWTTLGREAEAAALADAIVRARLAACVQTLPIRSTYWWQGKVESGRERLLLCKTRTTLVARLQSFIRERHPYEVPEIVVTPILGGSPAYLAWLRQETRPVRRKPARA
jgi:periplasmic divalent cation tolerance protein